MDLLEVGSTAIRNELIKDEELLSMLDGEYGPRIFITAADKQAIVPYVIMKFAWGGYRYTGWPISMDMIWFVWGVSNDQQESLDISGRVSNALLMKKLDYPDGWKDWVGATIVGEYTNPAFIQGINYWAHGPTIRLRAQKEFNNGSK